jgi:L-alanine-DL-glutamate epimerase-like enolase superfamily enzyme
MGRKEEMLSRIDEKVAAGFHTIKLKIGAIDFLQELEMIEYVRTRYSAKDLEIRLDANGGFSPQNVMQRLEKLAKYKIHSIEQPIKQGQWDIMSDICKNSPIPIALDEELIGINDKELKRQLLTAIKPDFIILKPALCGGFTGTKEWIAMASDYTDTKWWITSALESNIGLNAIAQWTAKTDTILPQGLGTGMLYDNNIPCPIFQKRDRLMYNPEKQWQIPTFDWVIP